MFLDESGLVDGVSAEGSCFMFAQLAARYDLIV